MNPLKRGTTALMLAALMLVMITGAAFAQDGANPVQFNKAHPISQAQYNPALMGEQGWDSTHTAEYYSAIQTASDAPMIAEASDAEPEPVIEMAMAQYNPALMAEQGWDSTHTLEYYNAIQTELDTQMIARFVDLNYLANTCGPC